MREKPSGRNSKHGAQKHHECGSRCRARSCIHAYCSLSLSLSVFQIDTASQQQHAPVATCGQQECTARHDPSLLLLMAAGMIIFSHKRARSNWDPTIEARGRSTRGHINLSNYNSEQQVLGSSIKSRGGGCNRCGACGRATSAGRPCTSITL
jgi:hypothetical protein